MERGSWLEEKLLPIAGKMTTNIYLKALRDGMTLATPLLIAGSIFMIIASFPIQSFADYLERVGIAAYLWKGVDSSFSLMGIIASFGIANSLASEKGTDGVSAGIISLSSYVTLTPFTSGEEGTSISLVYFGSRGIFVAILVGLVVGAIYSWFINKDYVIKMPDTVPPAVARSFTALVPAVVIISGTLLIYAVLNVFGIDNVHNIIANFIGNNISSVATTLPGVLLMIFLNSGLWFMGIHGAHVMGFITGPILVVNQDANRLALQAGQELPHIVTGTWMEAFVYLGGSGATIGLAFALAIIARQRNSSQITKNLARLTFTPSLFNINEPIMFGVPIVMNIALAIPFIIAPMANAIVSSFAMYFGLVSKTTGATMPWTTPAIISGFLSTGDWRASVLQVLLVAMDVMIYYAFYMAVERQNRRLEAI